MLEWDNLGIADESNFLQLFYEPRSEMLVAYFYKSIGSGYGIKSLWARHTSETCYLKITPPETEFSYEDPVISPASPHIFANVLQVQKREGAYDGYDWHSLVRIDLVSGERTVLVDVERLALETGLMKAWISTLHGVSGDGDEIYCSIACQKRGEDAVSPTEYYLSRFIIGEGRCERITRLTANYL